MNPRALLFFPPIHDFAAFDMCLKPYALLRIGRWLAEAGYDVTLLNALDYTETETLKVLGPVKRYSNGTGKFFRTVVPKPAALDGIPRYYARYGILEAAIGERILASRPDIVFIGTGMTYWYPGVREGVDAVRKIFPRVPVVLGGVYATLCPGHARETMGADHVVTGPALPALARILEDENLPVPEGPFPGSQLLLREGFLDAAAVRLHSGCPLACDYCASALVSGAFTQGSGEALFREVRSIHEAFGIRDFSFYDDALLVDAERGISPFLGRVIDSGLPLRFHVPNGLHVSLITEEIAAFMKRAGVTDFKLGFESAAPDFHAAHDNKFTRSMFEEAITNLKAGGFAPEEIAVYVLAGLPRQYPEEVEESIRFAAGFGIRVFVAEYSPIPGTPLWEASVAASPFPIAEEPLCQNNTIFPLRWERFTVERMYTLKQLARTLTRST